jgi:hypothetical protein
VSGGDTAAIALAGSWLSGLDGNYGLTGYLLYPTQGSTVNADGEPPQELLITASVDPETVTAPVPESPTVIAGALLLLPFAASMLRILRKKQTA